MCKQSGFSRYQKRVIKFLTDFLGADIPFTYERTQTNHLKVLIEGVPKPLYTSSTPSASNTFNNFTSEVKREVKAIKNTSEPKKRSPYPTKTTFIKIAASDRLVQSSVKAIRSRLESLKSREEEQVLASKSLESVNTYRADIVKQTLTLTMQARKQGAYLKPKEVKELEAKIRNHLDFMMPTMACYSNMLNAKTKYSNVESLVAVNDEKIEVAENTAPKQSAQLEVVKEPSSDTQSLPTDNLLKLSTSERIGALRQLSKIEALSLIEDIKQAIALNREQDIQSVVSLILEKDLPLEAIISRIEAA